jgi:alpha-methylacyl-CoA racemase
VTGPLAGVRVLELPAIGPVPLLGMLLADLGADVIRVDKLVSAPPDLAAGFVRSPMGRGRRSIALDLRRPGGAEVVLALAASADALVEGFRPGVAERLGVGPDAVLARNPRLVYGRMTGWGQTGPLAATAGHDITYLALTGLLHGIGPAERPVPPINYVADFGGGSMFLALGLVSALLHARATGEGQVVDAAMVDGASYLGSMTRVFQGQGGWREEREANLLDGGAPNYRCYATADGKWVAVGALEPQFWAVLVETLGLDPATTPSPYDPAQQSACRALLESTFATRTRDEWAATFESLDACVAPVLTLAEAKQHPHNVARAGFVDVDGLGVPAPAPRFSRTPGATGPVPAPGADTAALLADAGYDEAAVARLRADGVID